MPPERTNDAGAADGQVEIGGWMVSVKAIVGVLIVIGLTFFVFQNTETVQLRWLVFRFTMPLWGLTMVLVAAGMLIGWALHVRRHRRRP